MKFDSIQNLVKKNKQKNKKKTFRGVSGKYKTKSEIFLLMTVSHSVLFLAVFPPFIFQNENAIIQVIGLREECFR